MGIDLLTFPALLFHFLNYVEILWALRQVRQCHHTQKRWGSIQAK